MATDGHHFAIAAFAIACLAGCRSTPIPVYPVFATATPYSPAAGSHNAFDSYALIAQRVQLAAGKSLARAAFTPQAKDEAQKKLEPFVREIAAAEREPCEFEYSIRGPFDPVPYDAGWRLLGQCMAWDVQRATAAGDFDRAVAMVCVATRFGFDLTGGGALDASTGLHTADVARQAIAPYLDLLSASQLKSLESGVKSALIGRPPISRTIANERSGMMEAIQDLQNHYRDGTLTALETTLGPDAAEPISYLQNLQPTDPKRAAFFVSMEDYASKMADYDLQLSSTPVCKRGALKQPAIANDQPWRRLGKYVTRAPLGLIQIEDVTLARTRLLVIETELTRRRKLHMPFLHDLSGFSSSIGVDPFSGSSFIYQSNDEDFRVYSVGKDGVDNAGQTDSAYLQPDLRLERSEQ